jgi:hypothetical protein
MLSILFYISLLYSSELKHRNLTIISKELGNFKQIENAYFESNSVTSFKNEKSEIVKIKKVESKLKSNESKTKVIQSFMLQFQPQSSPYGGSITSNISCSEKLFFRPDYQVNKNVEVSMFELMSNEKFVLSKCKEANSKYFTHFYLVNCLESNELFELRLFSSKKITSKLEFKCLK